MSRKNSSMAGDVMLGMAAGAAISAAGMYLAGQNSSTMKKTAKKAAGAAEHAVTEVDKMLRSLTKSM